MLHHEMSHEVAEAILAGDGARARLAMEAHALGTAGGVLARVGQTRDERFIWRRTAFMSPA